MKPEDLKPPFKWKESFTTIEDRIFYSVQEGSDSFQFPGWEDPALFSKEQPVKIEYCSGNGAWIVEKAVESSHCNWVAVEKRFIRCRKIWSKMKNRTLGNLSIVNGEALSTTERYFPSSSVEEVYINFPDPWPKKKHAKYRLIQPTFIKELARILKNGGTVTVVTDDVPYSEEVIQHFLSSEEFTPVFEAPHFTNEWEGYGNSYFEALWRSKGREIRYMSFKR